MNKDYAIIDQIGSFDEERNVEVIYKRFFEIATKEGFKNNTFTMKKFCQKNWKSRQALTNEKLKALKWAMRNEKNPAKVYILCEEYTQDAKYAAEKWADRGVVTEVFVFADKEQFFIELPTFADGEIPWKRRLCQIWGPALGWTFSAPIWRDTEINSLDNYMERKDRKELLANAATATHITKTYHTKETFLRHNREICPDEEINEKIELWMTARENRLLSEMLEIDWTLYKGLPARVDIEGDVFSDWFDTGLEGKYFKNDKVVPFYEDSYEEEY